MSDIRNLTRNGETFYPLTHVEGLLNRNGTPVGVINDIFDVSEYNATGDPLVFTTYSSFSDLLTNHLSDIPEGKRKSGMTIRFLNSSSEYEQYRYRHRYLDTAEGIDDFKSPDNWVAN